MTITRRDFLGVTGGAFASALVFGAPALLSGCSSKSSGDNMNVLTVANNQVVTLDAFTEIEEPAGNYDMVELGHYPKGTMLFASGDAVAAALCTGETASPLSTCSLVKLSDGTKTQVLDRAVNHDKGYSIYAVRASNDLLVWVESNYLTSEWVLYSASITGATAIGKPVMLDEGDSQYDPPEISVIGSTAYWIVQPSESGSRTKEDSYLKASAGGSRSSSIITSHGRFNGGLSASGQVLTVMPRADSSSSVYYQLCAVAAGTGSVIASQVMPHSYRPSNAIYMGNAFAFTIPASYDYGGGIANVGTYYPMAGNQWLRLARQSLTAPGLCNGWLFAKSSSRTVFIDTVTQRYFVVPGPDGCEDYGDYSICSGEVTHVYNYATIIKIEGSQTTGQVLLRSITPKVTK